MDTSIVVALIALAGTLLTPVLKDIIEKHKGYSRRSISEKIDKLVTEMDAHKDELEKHTQHDIQMQVQQLRGVIIEFSKRIDRWKSGHIEYDDEFSDPEYWATYIHYVDLYEELCEQHDIKNGVCQNAIKKIRKAYEDVSFA